MMFINKLLISLSVFSLSFCQRGGWQKMDPSEISSQMIKSLFDQFQEKINVNVEDKLDLDSIQELKCQSIQIEKCKVKLEVQNQKDTLDFRTTFWQKEDQTVMITDVEQKIDGRYYSVLSNTVINSQQKQEINQ